MDMNAAWLTYPLTFTGMRMFECGDFTTEECDYYKQRWHFWYIADYVFALPTVAFFMTAIGIFTIAHIIMTLLLGYRRFKGPRIWQKLVAGLRYLSYRGFRVELLRWNSAPVGVLLLGAAGTIFFFCMDLVPKPYYWADEMFGGSPPLATRSGWLALGCMPFVFATASKTNWITLLTGVSHERLQVFHRWIAYAFFILALLHTFPFIVYHIHWHDMEMHFSESLLFYWTGIVALVFQAWLTFMSHSTMRRLGYEFFKVMHFASVVVFMITFFWHCDYTLTSWHYFVATAAVYVPCFVYPWLRTIFEYKWSQQAHIHVASGFTRITVPAKFHWTPGQHCFLRFTSFGIANAISTHPFTICSSPAQTADGKAELVFYIRHQNGFTKKLYQHALDHPDVAVPVVVDGPYGGINYPRFRDADRLLVIAGGSGAGWCLPFIEMFARFHSVPADSKDEERGLVAHAKERDANTEDPTLYVQPPRSSSLRVVLATRDIEHRDWFENTVSAMRTNTSVPHQSSPQMQVYLTGGLTAEADLANPVDHTTSSGSTSIDGGISSLEKRTEQRVSIQNFRSRPDLPAVIREEAAEAIEAGGMLSVYVCGPTSMQNDVRNAVAEENLKIVTSAGTGSVYLHTEHFSWA